MADEMLRKEGESLDEWEARIKAMPVPPPMSHVKAYTSFYAARRAALEEIQRQRNAEAK
jgi:hypothetical protein